MLFFQKPSLIFLLIGREKDIIDKFLLDFELPASNNSLWDVEVFEKTYDHKRMEERLKCFDAFVYVIDAKDMDDLKSHRQTLWEDLIWSPSTSGRPFIVFLTNSSMGLLTKEEIIESLSLIRITDRVWDVVEGQEEDNNLHGISEVKNQLFSFIEVVGRSPETLQRQDYVKKRLEKEEQN